MVSAHQAKISPMATMIKGVIFKDRGRINIDVLIGGIQDMALPATIERDERATIGLIIFIFSSMFTIRGPPYALHMTTRLNRNE